jgi:hypothetical protein
VRVTLHDNVHASAGEPHPDLRPPLTDAVRAPWVRAMHGRLREVAPDGGTFAADLDADVGTLRLRATRHGDDLTAIWSVGADERVVAASVLLAGPGGAALQHLRRCVPPLPFTAPDYAALESQPRPCLGTLYTDARWYDNARVELAATALALAALYGPEGRLTVGGEPAANPAPPARAAAAGPEARGALKFNFTRERLQHVMSMVAKKGGAAIERMPGSHFHAYPPPEFLSRPGVLRGRDVFDKLAESDWWVRWYDGRFDRLSFGEFLGFVDQVLEVENAYRQAAGVTVEGAPSPVNSSVWGAHPPAAPHERQPLKVSRTLDARRLVEDANVRRLFAAVTLEPASLPPPPPHS